MLTPYPTVYVPPGAAKPAWCPHKNAMALLPGVGPDVELDPAGRCIAGGGGICYGRPYDTALLWKRSAAGWWVALDGHLPQHLQRLEPHPRILVWRDVVGVTPDQVWAVPVLITPSTDGPRVTWRSACDRLWQQEGWRDSEDLVTLMHPLFAIAQGQRLDLDDAINQDYLVRLAISLLAIGQHVDADLCSLAGWMSFSLYARILRAAMDQGSTSPR